jgi:hypothetical protein
MNDPLFNDTYTGHRWKYGLTYRPLGFAQVPEGWVIKSDLPDVRFTYGTVDYPRELTQDEVDGYQLTPVAG